MNIFTSFKKNIKLAKLAKELGKPKSFTIEELLNDNSEKYKEELFDMVEKYDSLRSVLDNYSASRIDLNDIYRKLMTAGAGQWVKGHFVTIEAFAFPQTLDYLLSKNALGDKIDWQDVSFDLIMYFEKGKIGAV